MTSDDIRILQKATYTYQHGIRIQIMSVDDFGRLSYTTKGSIYISI